MTRNDIIRKIAEQMPLLRERDIADMLHFTLEAMADAMVRGETIELRNFGVFECVERKARIGRDFQNPGKGVPIPAVRSVRFRLGKTLKERMEK